jgi:hypothetical protein
MINIKNNANQCYTIRGAKLYHSISKHNSWLCNTATKTRLKRIAKAQGFQHISKKYYINSSIADCKYNDIKTLYLENRDYGLGDPPHWPCHTLYQQKLALASPTSGSLSVGIVRSRTKATELVCFICPAIWHLSAKKINIYVNEIPDTVQTAARGTFQLFRKVHSPPNEI